MPFWANIIIISVIAFFVSLILTVMLLYMLIFPLINKLFKTELPSYNYTFGEDNIDDNMAESTEPSVLRSKESASVKDRVKVPERQSHTTPPATARPRFVDFHKDVPTVKLPDIMAKEKTDELNVSKINAAVVSTKMERIAKRDESPIKPTPKADTKKVDIKTDTKKVDGKENIKKVDSNTDTKKIETKKITKTKSSNKK